MKKMCKKLATHAIRPILHVEFDYDIYFIIWHHGHVKKRYEGSNLSKKVRF